jgi:hypothetical protein
MALRKEKERAMQMMVVGTGVIKTTSQTKEPWCRSGKE